MTTDILTVNKDSDVVENNTYKLSEIDNHLSNGLSLTALFTDISWYNEILAKTILLSSHFSIDRGARPGANEFTYPRGSYKIEKDFLTPLIKESKKASTLYIEPDSVAFTCYESRESLKNNKKTGALAWIDKYENARDENGKLIRERINDYRDEWYQVNYPETKADIVIMINPGKRLSSFIVKTQNCIIDQRFVKFYKNENRKDIPIFHALMNSVFTMFSIESIGFGRGDCVLDLSETNIKSKLRILNPDLLSEENKKSILEAFKPLLERRVYNVDEELDQEDRIEFEKVVFESFGIPELREKVTKSLKKMVSIRHSPKMKPT